MADIIIEIYITDLSVRYDIDDTFIHSAFIVHIQIWRIDYSQF